MNEQGTCTGTRGIVFVELSFIQLHFGACIQAGELSNLVEVTHALAQKVASTLNEKKQFSYLVQCNGNFISPLGEVASTPVNDVFSCVLEIWLFVIQWLGSTRGEGIRSTAVFMLEGDNYRISPCHVRAKLSV